MSKNVVNNREGYAYPDQNIMNLFCGIVGDSNVLLTILSGFNIEKFDSINLRVGKSTTYDFNADGKKDIITAKCSATGLVYQLNGKCLTKINNVG